MQAIPMNPQPSISLAGISIVTIVMIMLVIVAERAGLPLLWVRTFLCLIAALGLLSVIASARTTNERLFFGLFALGAPVSASLVTTMVIMMMTGTLYSSGSSTLWLATILGSLLGLVIAHLLARYRPDQATGFGTNAGFGKASGLLRGLSLLLIGFGLALPALESTTQEAMRIFGLDASTAMLLILAPGVIAILLGGAQAGLALALSFCLVGVIAVAGLIILGLASLGPLPLPGQSELQTLQAITEARERWGVASPLHLTQWPRLDLALQVDALRWLILAALMTTGVLLSLTPAAPLQRRSFVVSSTLLIMLLPLAIIIIGGYAIEAAGIGFVGTQITRPPTGMVEAARLGLITICGASTDSAEAIRLACRLSPRDGAIFAWSQIGLTQAFVESGLPVAIGYNASISLFTGATKLIFSLVALTIGLWLAAQGLGRNLLARNRQAAGLASFRLGLTRLSLVLIAIAIGSLQIMHGALPRDGIVALVSAGALLCLVSEGMTYLRSRSDSAALSKRSPASAQGKAT